MAGMEGDGKHEIIVGSDQHRGLVIMRFNRSIEWVGMEAENCMQIAGALAHEAYAMRFKRPPKDTEMSRIFQDIQKEVSKEQRAVLANRVVLIMNTGVVQHRDPLWTAEAIVDRILADTK